MKLFVQRRGRGQRLLCLHGLFGSSNNWGTLASQLEEHFELILPDLRNHGRSPHAGESSLEDMAFDIAELLEEGGGGPIDILGHSLGARVAMRLALDQPERCKRLLLADMAPGSYGPLFPELFEAFRHFPLSRIQSRDAADEALRLKIPSDSLRAFVLTNLARQSDGAFAWKANWRALEAAAPSWQKELEGATPFSGRTLFLFGANSNYLRDSDKSLIERLFPNSKIEILPEAGHWLHVDQPLAFLKAVQNFFAS